MFAVDGGSEERDDDGGEKGDDEEEDGEVEEVDLGDDGGAGVLLTTRRWPVPEVQAHPDDPHQQTHHQSPERPL